jgi:hypothetical protein
LRPKSIKLTITKYLDDVKRMYRDCNWLDIINQKDFNAPSELQHMRIDVPKKDRYTPNNLMKSFMRLLEFLLKKDGTLFMWKEEVRKEN